MSQFSIRFNMGYRDFWTFLFSKKLCSACGKPLQRRIAQESEGTRLHWDFSLTEIRAWYGEKIEATFLYECESCGIVYSLSDIRNGEAGTKLSG